MADQDELYEGNGTQTAVARGSPVTTPTGFSGQPGSGRSQYEAQPHERRSSKYRERDRERDKDKDRERERDHDRDRGRGRDKDRKRDRGDRDRESDCHHRKHRERSPKREHRERSEKREHRERSEKKEHRGCCDDRDRHQSRDRDVERDCDRDVNRRHSSRSHSKGHHRRSRSRSNSKRVSGFDQGPFQTIPMVTPGVIAGQLPAVAPVIPEMLLNMFNFTTPQASRHARIVYVGGIPPSANEQTVAIYFNQVMAAIGGNTAGPGDAVLNVYLYRDKKFAFVEMRSVEEASNAIALDGIMFEGASVKVRRPADYNPSLAAGLGPSQPNPNLNLGAVGLTPGSAGALEGPDLIFVGGLPCYFTESQVRELLESFGALRGFYLGKDRETGNSKGHAFCIYRDPSVTDTACAALTGIKIGDKTLTARRANQRASLPRPDRESIMLQAQQQVEMQRLAYQIGIAVPTKVVCLTQVVSADELRDDEEYKEILEDITEEGHKYGNLVKVVIPRPDPSGARVTGVGRAFLEYADVDGSTEGRTRMHGRKFGANQVVAVFYPEDKFANEDYDA